MEKTLIIRNREDMNKIEGKEELKQSIEEKFEVLEEYYDDVSEGGYIVILEDEKDISDIKEFENLNIKTVADIEKNNEYGQDSLTFDNYKETVILISADYGIVVYINVNLL